MKKGSIILVCFIALSLNTAFCIKTQAEDYNKNEVSQLQVQDKSDSIQEYSEMNEDDLFLKGLNDFSVNSASLILNKNNPKVNSLYSPISVYMALELLAETADGKTQEEILKVLNTNDINNMSEENKKLFENLVFENETGKISIANSIWLNDNIKFNQGCVDKLAQNYYTDTFNVDFGSSSTSKKISEWISKNTGGKLGNNSDEFMTAPSEVMRLFNTVYFNDQWANKFKKYKTGPDNFNLENNEKVICNFMNSESGVYSYLKGENYTSTKLSFKNGGSMVFILPDENVSPYDIIENQNTLTEALNPYGKKFAILKIPKFKFSTQLDLNESLQNLGINNAFDRNNADFSKLSESKPLFVSQVIQESTISIDEGGCEAAAFTEILMAGSRPGLLGVGKPEIILLNRPFIFAIMSKEEVPLFIGVINNPTS
jgi:serine protease inhibitor